MKAYVVLATKGRPTDIPVILDILQRQTVIPDHIVVVGTMEGDFGEGRRVANGDSAISFELSARPGLPIQRNVGIEAILSKHGDADDNFMIAYFDDDFRPEFDWIERARDVLDAHDVGSGGWYIRTWNFRG